MFYEVTVKISRTQKDGSEKEVKELYLTDCSTFTEAENTGTHVFADYGLDGDVVAIKRSNILEIANPMDARNSYFRATIVNTTLDYLGREKDIKYYVLFRAYDISEANRLANDYMKQGLQNMKLDAIVKTKILDVI